MWLIIFISGLIIGGSFGALIMGVIAGGVQECHPRADHE